MDLQKKASKKLPRIEQDERQLPHKILENGRDTKSIVRTYTNLKGNNIKLSINSERIRNGVLIFFSETKKEQELENLHIQTETILEAVNNSILMIDKDRKVVLCNKAMEEVFETDREAIMGIDIDKLSELVKFQVQESSDLGLKGNAKENLYEVSLTSFRGNEKDMLLHSTSIQMLMEM